MIKPSVLMLDEPTAGVSPIVMAKTVAQTVVVAIAVNAGRERLAPPRVSAIAIPRVMEKIAVSMAVASRAAPARKG